MCFSRWNGRSNVVETTESLYPIQKQKGFRECISNNKSSGSAAVFFRVPPVAKLGLERLSNLRTLDLI